MDTKMMTAAQDAQSEGYQEVLYWSLKDKGYRTIIFQILAIPVFILVGLAFSILAIKLGKFPGGGNMNTLEFAAILISIIATMILHEGVHGLAMRLFGARPIYGVLWKQLVFFATSPGYRYRRNAYILVVLAPLIVLSLLVILGIILFKANFWILLLILCGAVNAGGSFGDMWMASIVLRYPRLALVVDEKDGMRIFLPA